MPPSRTLGDSLWRKYHGLKGQALAQAAEAKDDKKLVDAFGAVAKSCVGCHSTYLHDALAPFAHDEPGEPLPCAYSDSCEDDQAATD